MSRVGAMGRQRWAWGVVAACLAMGTAAGAQAHHAGAGAHAKAADAAAHAKAADGAAAPAEGDRPAGSTAFKNVFWQPNEMVQGSVTFFTVEMAKPASRISGKFLGKELSFFRDASPDKANVWYALAGVDLETAPGSYEVAVTATVPGRGIVHTFQKVEVAAGDFKAGTVQVPENFVNPDEAGKKQIALDAAAKSRAYAHLTLKPEWSGDFVKPVAAPSTPSFGMTRIYNEEMSSEHRGTDFPVKEGAVVSASNAGTVVLAKEMFYEGNCIILDHGQRFFTIYMHLSKMDVKAGDRVTKGQHLGLTGATGRVTGPHLHMGVRWNGAYLDPTRLLALTLPETGAAVPEKKPATPRRAHR